MQSSSKLYDLYIKKNYLNSTGGYIKCTICQSGPTIMNNVMSKIQGKKNDDTDFSSDINLPLQNEKF